MTTAATPSRTPGRRRSSTAAILANVATGLGAVLFLGAFVWAALLYRPYAVPTDSMAPTINAGERVLAERVEGTEVRRGDVVVFRDTTWGDLPMIKRVVGVGGDTVVCCDAEGRLTINGEPVSEPYLDTPGRASATEFSATVPEGRLFLLGDHRRDSVDSRSRLAGGATADGAVPRDAVVARVDVTAWPLGTAGVVERPEGFAELPGGISEPGPLPTLFWAGATGAVLILGGAAQGPIARRAGRRGRH
ncbi:MULTISPECIES: signal peptidase I [unclassified Streptomyces]|uniref:signal peptidase I n=1 Tax=unclassified Streptomyces TaxID=2593676 RepID=UPI0022B70AC1|nr:MULTISPECIES: signal peptidase I [unclassified Streptomyces]MCZ7416272.1 signal peptidase I [Streptomyces sp. WMMC897]MCZ7433918.1 signal peptidase I [Streptomyces sp. WMMC1477]